MAERHKSGRIQEPVYHDKIERPGMQRAAKRDMFVDLYLATGDERLAYEQAGYQCKNPKSLASAANRLRQDPYVRSEIQRKTEEQGEEHPLVRHGKAPADMPAIATKQERQEFWTTVMRDHAQDMPYRLKASELLARTQGDFIEQVHVVLSSDVRKMVQSLLGLDEDEEDDDYVDITPGAAP